MQKCSSAVTRRDEVGKDFKDKCVSAPVTCAALVARPINNHKRSGQVPLVSGARGIRRDDGGLHRITCILREFMWGG